MIAVAGGIGAGKSIVSRILRLKGYGVFDCDFEARKLMESDGALKEAVSEAAGEEIYVNQGRLDRRKLAAILFDDEEVRRKVNAAVHEAVRKRIRGWLEESDKNRFVETAIAGESQLAEMADEIWIVEASEATRLERVKARDGRNEEETRRIIKAQEREEDMLAETGIPLRRISNNPEDNLLPQIENLLNGMT